MPFHCGNAMLQRNVVINVHSNLERCVHIFVRFSQVILIIRISADLFKTERVNCAKKLSYKFFLTFTFLSHLSLLLSLSI